MSDDYQGSIAQENVSYNTLAVFSTTPGDNYYKLMIFVGLSQSDLFFEDAPVAAELRIVSNSSFASETKGRLKDWLTAFFSGAGSAQVAVVVFNDGAAAWDPAGLTVAMDSYKHMAYWKTMLYLEDYADPDPDVLDYAAVAALATLQKTNVALSGPVLVNEYSSSVLTKSGTSVSEKLAAADLSAFSVYHPDGMEKAPALVQLGKTLGFLNDTGTPVGNSLDYVALSLISASGVAGANLGQTQQLNLKSLNVGYFKTVGNGTGNVALIGGQSLQGDVLAANWVTEYCDYVNEIKTAELITTMNSYKNRKAYNQILAQLSAQLEKFGETVGTGRLRDIKITAPIFSSLPESSGDTFVIPNAWTATYVDNIREVSVQGTLTIQL